MFNFIEKEVEESPFVSDGSKQILRLFTGTKKETEND